MARPREYTYKRSLPGLCTLMPAVCSSTWPMLRRFWSSMRWRVMTLTDCGVSRRLRLSLVAVLVEPVV
ncbi:hypothetical protein D3C79_854110 [compost metagenome]